MTNAPNLVVAGAPDIARKLRETGRFRKVFDAASATELRDLSRGGQVTPPAAFMFAPAFGEDIPGATVAALANGLAGSGFTVLVHGVFAERGEALDDRVQVTGRKLVLSDLLATLGAAPASEKTSEPAPTPSPEPAEAPAPAVQTPQPLEPAATASPWQAAPAEQSPWTTSAPAPAEPQDTPPAAWSPEPIAAEPPKPESQPAQQTSWQPVPIPPSDGSPANGWAANGWSPNGTTPNGPVPNGTVPNGTAAHGSVPFPAAVPPVFQPPTEQVSPNAWAPAPTAQAQAPLPMTQVPFPQAAAPMPVPVAPQDFPPAGAQAQPSIEAAPELPALGGTGPNGTHSPWTQAQAGPPVKKRGRVIAVASAKGGVGKTSTTVNLAVYAAKTLQAAGRTGSVVLVDTNFQQADVARYLGLDSPTVLDLFQAPGALSPETVRSHLAQVSQIDLYALLGPPDAITADPAMINSALYRRILAVLRETFDYVFIDTPVAELYHMTFADLILPEADAILVPVEPNRVTLQAARSWLHAITLPQHARGGGVDPGKLSLLLNRARVDVDCGPEEVMDLMPGWRFIGMIPENEAWMRAVNNHRLVALSGDAALEETFRAILQQLTGDPVFTTTVEAKPSAGWMQRWRKLLGL